MKVSVDSFTPREMVAAVESAFKSAGLDVSVSADWKKDLRLAKRGWVFELIFDQPLSAILAALRDAAQNDPWKGLKHIITRIRTAGDNTWSKWPWEGVILLKSNDGIQLIIDEIPDEAYQALFEVTRQEFAEGAFAWDRTDWAWCVPPAKQRGLWGWLKRHLRRHSDR